MTRTKSRPPSIARAAFPLVLALVTTAAPASGRDRAVRCQRAIERGGHWYATRLLDTIERCAQSATGSLTDCLDSAPERALLDRSRTNWARRAGPACAGVELQAWLGYLATCAPPVSSCSFPSPVIDAVGPQNDLLDCLACRIEDRLRSTGVLLFANGSSANICQGALGRAGLGILELLLDHIHSCLERGQSESIAGCLADPALAAKEADKVEAWRASAESECRAVDPFRDLGYSTYCGGVVPDLPPSCGQPAPSCAFPAISALSQPGVDNDLLDCLQCQVEEAALDVARG